MTSLSERLSCVHVGLIISSQIRTGGLMSSSDWATEILKYWYGQWLTCETLSLTKLLHWRLMNIRGSNTGMLPIFSLQSQQAIFITVSSTFNNFTFYNTGKQHFYFILLYLNDFWCYLESHSCHRIVLVSQNSCYCVTMVQHYIHPFRTSDNLIS